MRKQQNQAHNVTTSDSTLLVLFNKPFEVLCQFSADGDKRTLAEFIRIPSIYAAGRLDFDSEGLLILTNNGKLQQAISHPRFKLPKTYWVQVEGDITEDALQQMRSGIQLNDGITLPAKARKIEPPEVWERVPPIRARKSIPTSWVELIIREGRNRQVRRMTAAAGFPTLRLIRAAIGDFKVTGLAPGEIRMLGVESLPASLQKLIETKSAEPIAKTSTAIVRKKALTPASGHGPDNRTPGRPPTRQRRSASPSSRKVPRS